MIQLADEAGHIRFVSPQEWEETILPQGIRTAWNNPDHLAVFILKAIQISFHSEMLQPAERLRSIDKNSARSAYILAMVYIKLQRTQDAEHVLLEEALREQDSHPGLMEITETTEMSRDEFPRARYE